MAKKKNKFSYYKVIQQYGEKYGWEDIDFYETNSYFCFKSRKERLEYKENIKLYRINLPEPYRIVNRRELNK
jgi:predicted nucleotidyltransferase